MDSTANGVSLPGREIAEYRGCKSKKSYDTEWEAINMAAYVREQTGHKSIHEYKCLFCNHWHVGHQRHRRKTTAEG